MFRRQRIVKRYILAAGIVLAAIDISTGAPGWAAVHLLISVLCYLAWRWAFRCEERAALAKLALQSRRAPRDWYVEVRGQRYASIEFRYLGQSTTCGCGTPCDHWVVVRPPELPDDVEPHEIHIRGTISEHTIIDLW